MYGLSVCVCWCAALVAAHVPRHGPHRHVHVYVPSCRYKHIIKTQVDMAQRLMVPSTVPVACSSAILTCSPVWLVSLSLFSGADRGHAPGVHDAHRLPAGPQPGAHVFPVIAPPLSQWPHRSHRSRSSRPLLPPPIQRLVPSPCVPLQWLLAVNRWRAAVTAVPSFALTLACRRISPALRDTLDLSCLKVPTTPLPEYT